MTDASTREPRVVDALVDEWRQIADLMRRSHRGALASAEHPAGLERPGHRRPRDRDRVHAGGRDRPTGGPGPDGVSTHVQNDIAAMNEQWVDSMRGLEPAEMLDRFRPITKRPCRFTAIDVAGGIRRAFVDPGRAGELRALHADSRLRLLARTSRTSATPLRSPGTIRDHRPRSRWTRSCSHSVSSSGRRPGRPKVRPLHSASAVA